jgi:hypothetical protein
MYINSKTCLTVCKFAMVRDNDLLLKSLMWQTKHLVQYQTFEFLSTVNIAWHLKSVD